ncbi:S8 family peptidase [Okeanomitos corallinicola TIOX110]|uniref:S8 family peptidase n=1 Tax=Okeanomitos corallinicola TIOX110 TaxID=3133117 RepID=A0ABZ2UXX9_9CYAN
MIKFDIAETLNSSNQLNIAPTDSINSFQTAVDSSLSFKNHSSLPSDAKEEPIFNTNSYNFNNGYGLVNAGKAVSTVTGESPYVDAPPLGGNNWGADLVKAPTAWQNGYTGQGIIVAVLDTGVDYNHNDLNSNIWINTKEIAGNGIDDDGNGFVDDVRGWNFDGNNNNVLDDESHGTHVAGTIAAKNDGNGVTGIAYNSQIMAVKVLDENGSGSYSNIANGVRYAVDNGANVINLSLGGNSGNNTLKSAIEYASNKGVIVVMAAGNEGASQPSYPARYANDFGIAVGAVNQSNQFTDFSNRSGSQEIKYVTAPGEDIYSTVPNNKYATYSGTSMAAPHVAGVVALMLSANPNLTDSQVRDIIVNTSENTTNPQQPQQPNQPSNPSPSPFPFPFPIDLLPFGLINIGAILPNIGAGFPDIGSGFPIGFDTQSNMQLPPIVISVGENNLGLKFGGIETKTPQIENFSYYSGSDEMWELRYYDSNVNNSLVKEEIEKYDADRFL